MKKLIMATVAAQYTLMSPQIAHSQMLEEVLVTARKKPETLMDAPLAVSVVDGDTLNREGITNLEQLSSQVPGLQLGRAALSSSIYIRGIGSSTNVGFEQSAGMYVDGIYKSGAGNSPNLLSIWTGLRSFAAHKACYLGKIPWQVLSK